MKRVFIGGFHHESDTFNPIITKRDDITVRRGEELRKETREDSISGIISYLEEKGYEIVLSLHARAVPNGEWDKEYYLSLKDEFLSSLKDSLPVDGICLALHGSMRVQNIGSAEEDLLRDIRRISPLVPIVASLDMHATVTKEMLEAATAFVGYKCAPHTDTVETGRKAAEILDRILEGEIDVVMEGYHIPFLLSGEQSETNTSPMKEIMDEIREMEKERGVVSLSLLLGFPWADTANMGLTALSICDKNRENAREKAERVARLVWDKRHSFKFYSPTYEEKEAIEKTIEELEKGETPIVLSDSGDNPTAGSSGDVTSFLSLLLSSPLSHLEPPLVYQAFYDTEVVKKAKEEGSGSRIKCSLGALFDRKTSSPIMVDALVKSISSYEGSDIVLLSISGIDVVVTNKHIGCYDPDIMRKLGVVPEERKVICLKLGYLEPEIKAIAKKSFLVLTAGSTNEIFSRLSYKRINRPIFPLDSDDLEIERM